MATDDEILLDAFVRVSPDPNFLQAVDKVADDAIKRITEKFAAVTIPGPRIGDSAGPAGAVAQQISQLAQLNSQQQAAEQRREQAAQRLLDLQREIENLQGRGRTTFTPATRERAIQAEVRATEELQRAQREYARLLSANDPSVSSEDAAIQKQIVEYQKERNQAEKDYRQAIIDVEQAQLKASRFEKPSRSKFTAEAVASAQAERDRIVASGAGAVEVAAAELRLEEIRTKFAASQAKRSKDAQKAQDDLQAAILRSTEAESRRTALSAEIVTDTDALAKSRIAAEQRVAESSERVAAARAEITRQEEGAQRYTENRASRLSAAQAELVSATQAEVDARQQVLNINEQILSVTRAQAAAEAAVTAEIQRQAQADAAQPPSANPPAAGGSGQPPRRRGRGRAGAPPPPDPPTTPPDDDGEADELARAYRNATRQVQDLIREISRLNQIKPEINTQETKEDLRILKTAVEDIRIALSRSGEDNDPFGIEQAISRLPDLQGRLDQVSRRISESRALREEFDDVASRAKNTITSGRITAGENRALNPGIVSGQDREDLIIYTNEIRKQEEAVKRLSAAFDGTQDSIDRLNAAEQNLVVRQQKLAEKEELIAQTRGRSFNTLSNNAYQLGQAFEDFSVGFSLNGLAGGIRGAANNVAFILNDLSRLESTKALTTDLFVRFRKDIPVKQARELGEKMANLIPLAAGIGSAVAITIVPAVVEWLESLNDVELKLIDIQERIKQTSSDSDFSSGLRNSNDELLRTLKSAGSVREIIAEIDRIRFESDQNNKGIGEKFKAFGDSGDLSASLENIKKIRNATNDYEKELTKLLKIVPPVPNFGTVENADPFKIQNDRKKELEELKKQQKQVEISYKSLAAAQVEVASGGQNQAQKIAEANAAYRSLEETIKELEKRKAFGKAKDIEDAKSQVKAFGDELDKIAKKSEETNALVLQLPDSLQAVVDHSEKIASSLDVARANARGIVDDEAVMLDEMRKQNDEFRELLNLQLQAAREANVSPDLVNSANRAATQTQFRLQEIEILKEIKKREEEIEKEKDRRSGKSKFTQFEQFSKDLQTNVLSVESDNKDVIKENTEEIRRLKDLLALLRRNRNENLQDLPDNPMKAIKQLEDRRIDFNRELENIALPAGAKVKLFFQDMLDSFDDRTGVRFEQSQIPAFPEFPKQTGIADFVKGIIPIALPPVPLGEAVFATKVVSAIMEAVSAIATPIVSEQKNTTEAVKKIGGARAQ